MNTTMTRRGRMILVVAAGAIALCGGGCSQGLLSASIFGGSGGGPTGTGVYVNGVEATQWEVAGYAARVGYVNPGRYFLDGFGNYGYEGGPIMGNLNGGSMASSGGGGGGGGDGGSTGTMSSTGIIVNSAGAITKSGNSAYSGN